MPITTGRWSLLSTGLIPLRSAVFIEEQQVPEALEWDEDDADALHLLATDDAGEVVGCARLLANGHIGRMAVGRTYRGQGWGTRLLQAAETAALAQGNAEVFLHAQTHAVPFYAARGYQVCSDEFLDAGIPHQTMRKTLSAAS